ncbi:hypothetical protein [Brevibacillus dissolubilis]|uniref:hypothetical protein n=1 Tax=Brevibacillus dissolubilis TaxID=1844116 RepID=UPI001117182D|nr:hypothetical protein [Brevibacillus dissolubilis]
MKRITFAAPEEVADYCREEDVILVVEYQDENGRQRQVKLAPDQLQDLGVYWEKPGTMAYFKKEKIFYEIVAGWTKR